MNTYIHKEDGSIEAVTITATFPIEGGYTMIECINSQGVCYSTTEQDIYYQPATVLHLP